MALPFDPLNRPEDDERLRAILGGDASAPRGPIDPQRVAQEVLEMFRQRPIEPPPRQPSAWEIARRSFAAGVGDVLSGAAGASQWLGAEGLAQRLEQAARPLQEQAPEGFQPTSWRDFLDPRFWTSSVSRTLPFTLALIPASILGYAGGSTAAATLGLGALGRAVAGALAGTAVARPLEAAFEAGATYQEALRRGMSEEEAERAANTVFRQNLALAGTDVAQMLAAFTPAGRVTERLAGRLGSTLAGRAAVTAGRIVGAAIPEAGEEVAQEVIQRRALGEPVQADMGLATAGVLGGLMGGLFGVSGEVFSAIRDRSLQAVSPELRQQYQRARDEALRAGMPQNQADAVGLNAVASTSEGFEAVRNAARQVAEEIQSDPERWRAVVEAYRQARREPPPAPEPAPSQAQEVSRETLAQQAPEVLRPFVGGRLTRQLLLEMPVEQQRAIAEMLTDEVAQRYRITVQPAARQYLRLRFHPDYDRLIRAWEAAGVPNDLIERAIVRTAPESLKKRQERLVRHGILDLPMYRGGWVAIREGQARFEQVRQYAQEGKRVDLTNVTFEAPQPVAQAPQQQPAPQPTEAPAQEAQSVPAPREEAPATESPQRTLPFEQAPAAQPARAPQAAAPAVQPAQAPAQAPATPEAPTQATAPQAAPSVSGRGPSAVQALQVHAPRETTFSTPRGSIRLRFVSPEQQEAFAYVASGALDKPEAQARFRALLGLPENVDVQALGRAWYEQVSAAFGQLEPGTTYVVPPPPISMAQRLSQAEERRNLAERQANVDTLTGLANRRALDRALPSAEADPNWRIIVFDANNFGQVNKRVSHEAGDQLIREIAQAIKSAADSVGMGERVFRRGGDEFVVIVPAEHAERVRDLAEQTFGSRQVAGVEISLTGSIGNTFAEADAGLQARKRTRKAQRPAQAQVQAEDAEQDQLTGQAPAEQHVAETPFDTPLVRQLRFEQSAMISTKSINTPARRALRARIINELYGTGAPRKERVAYIIMGSPAAGKSTIAERLAQQEGAMVIDADLAKERLPEYGSGRYAGVVHEESSDIAKAVLDRAVETGDNVVLPIVGRTLDKVRLLRDSLRERGYRVHLILVDLPAEEAARRAVRRLERTGRFVDPAYVLSVGDAPRRNYDILKQEGGWESYAAYSAQVPEGEPFRPLESSASSSEAQATTGLPVRGRVPGRLLGGRPDQGGPGGVEAQEAGPEAQQPVPAVEEAAPTSEAPRAAPQPVAARMAAEGKAAQARTERGTAVDVRFVVVDAADLISSHDTGFRPDPRYPAQLQPRDRSRAASELQVNRIAHNLEPELLAESPLASQGAPIIGPDMAVESGNARVIAIKLAYERGLPSAERYRQWLIDNAERFGLSKEQVQAIQQPVLVRLRTSEVDRVRFAQEANEAPVAAMSATEQALADASRITPELAALFVPNEDGDVLTLANRDFVKRFLAEVVGPSEQGRYLLPDGSLSADGVRRIEAALYAAAYRDPNIVMKMAESPDDNIRNISRAALAAAPRFVQLRALAERGAVRADLDPTEDIAQAIRLILDLRQRGETLEAYLATGKMWDDYSRQAKQWAKLFDTYKRSRKAILRLFNAYASAWEHAGSPAQSSLLVERDLSKDDLLDYISRKVAEEYGREPRSSQATLFSGASAEGGVANAKDGEVGAGAPGEGVSQAAGVGSQATQSRLVAVEEELKAAAERGAEERRRQEGVAMGAGIGLPPFVRTRPIQQQKSPYAFTDPEIESRFEAARGLPRPSWRERTREWVQTMINRFTREFEHLPRTAQFAPARYALLQFLKQAEVATDRAIRMLDGVTADLDADSYDLFRRKVILDDLSHDAENDMLLPFGFTKDSLAREKARIDALVEQNEAVKQALERRRKLWEAVRNDYIEAAEAVGFRVRDRLQREDYFRHQVIEYAAYHRVGGHGRRLQMPVNRGWLKRRGGTSLDINSEYLEAEFEVLRDMLYDTERFRVIQEIKRHYDIRPELQRQAAAANMRELRQMLIEERASRPHQVKLSGEPDASTITPGELERVLRGFRRRIAVAMSQLRELAAEGRLWVGEQGEWSDIVEGLEEEQYAYEDWLEATDSEGESPWPTSVPGEPMDPASRRFFEYLAALYKAGGQPGQKQAAAIFKTISERREWIKETLGPRYKTWENFVPETHAIWQPRKGNRLYPATTVSEKLATMLLEGQVEELGITKDDLRRALVLGTPWQQYVVPKELAAQLDQLVEAPPPSYVRQALTVLTGLWKVKVLLSPGRVFKYNLRNLTGDAEHVALGNPSTFRKLPQAAKDILEVMVRGKQPTGEFYEWYRRGGMQSLLQVQELQDVAKLPIFERFAKAAEKSTSASALEVLKRYWKTARLSTDAREAWLRYAAYLDYLEQIRKNNGKPLNYGASIPEEIDALTDPRDKAFVLSNQLLGAYDQVSVEGQHLRQLLLPFWSWQEVNMRWYIQAFRNTARDRRLATMVGRKLLGTAAKSPLLAYRVGKFAIKAAAFSAMLAVYNNLFWPDEERDLPEDVRRRPHIILGRDEQGRVIYFSNVGALADFLEWFGLDELPSDVADWLSGRRSLADIAKEASTDWLNKLWQLVTPFIKWPVEIAAKVQFFPDFREPRRLRDPWLYVAQQLGVEPLYRYARGLPMRTNGGIQDWMIYRVDADESAYWDIIDRREEFARKIGKPTGGFSDSQRSQALYWLKISLRYGDTQAARRWLLEYARLGGTPQGLEQSLRSMDPLYGLNEVEKRAFIATLTPEEVYRLEQAYRFYERVLKGLSSLSRPASPSSR